MSLEDRDKPLKRGRGSQKKTKVLAMAESKTVENQETGKKPKKVRYLKMKVINDLKSDTITKNVKEHVENTADLTTDDSTSHTQLKEHIHSHTASVIPHEELPNVPPWVHIAGRIFQNETRILTILSKSVVINSTGVISVKNSLTGSW